MVNWIIHPLEWFRIPPYQSAAVDMNNLHLTSTLMQRKCSGFLLGMVEDPQQMFVNLVLVGVSVVTTIIND